MDLNKLSRCYRGVSFNCFSILSSRQYFLWPCDIGKRGEGNTPWEIIWGRWLPMEEDTGFQCNSFKVSLWYFRIRIISSCCWSWYFLWENPFTISQCLWLFEKKAIFWPATSFTLKSCGLTIEVVLQFGLGSVEIKCVHGLLSCKDQSVKRSLACTCWQWKFQLTQRNKFLCLNFLLRSIGYLNAVLVMIQHFQWCCESNLKTVHPFIASISQEATAHIPQLYSMHSLPCIECKIIIKTKHSLFVQNRFTSQKHNLCKGLVIKKNTFRSVNSCSLWLCALRPALHQQFIL